MKLTRWDPLREMEDVFGRYSRAMSAPRSGNQESIATGDWAPRVDIAETDKEFIIKAEIPMVKKDDVKVTVADSLLTIRGKRKPKKEEKDKKLHRVERLYASFTRSFTLPDNVDESEIKASFEDGMINFMVPKTEKAKAINVKIK